MIPVSEFRPIVDAWVAEFDAPEDAYQRLATTSGLTADAWRKRLYSNGLWWTFVELDDQDVDDFLTAANITHLWYEPPLLRHRPAAGHVSAKVRLPGERRRIKRLSKSARLTREQVFAVHKLHIDGGLSMREIARRGYEQWGYASEKSCLSSLCDLLASYGLERRDRIEATIAASTTHGHGARNNKAAYKRWHRRAFGFWKSDKRPGEQPRPTCAGIRRNYPRKGERCQRPALLDSVFCVAHDPRREDHRQAQLAAMRERRGA